jgi:hypothetical protein
MAQRPAGRPKATDPRDVRVTVRLTEAEVDQVYRAMGREDSLAGLIRRCITGYLGQFSGQERRDNQEARIQRARRAARRADATPRPDLEHAIGQALHTAEEELA